MSSLFLAVATTPFHNARQRLYIKIILYAVMQEPKSRIKETIIVRLLCVDKLVFRGKVKECGKREKERKEEREGRER